MTTGRVVRALLLLLLGGLLAPVACEPAQAPAWELNGRLVDLTHAFDGETVYWPTEDPFLLNVEAKGWTDGGYYYEANSFAAAEHGGTHLDAPVHFHEGGWTAEEIPLDRLIGAGACVDVTEVCAQDRDHLVSVADLKADEARSGRIPEGALVLIHTGYGRHWPDRALYMGTDRRGAEGVADLHFPGLHPDAARWLVRERKVRAVGLDTPSIDHGPSTTFDAHQVLFADNVPAFENVANLAELPARDFVVMALPMKIRGGSGGPLRIVAVVPEGTR